MPMYPIKCGCGFEGDVFQTVAGLVAADSKLACPECSAMCEQNYAAKTIALHGSCIMFTGVKKESMTEGFHPKEVQRARELMGDDLGGCIQDNGSVHFRDRDQRTKWDQKEAETKAINTEKRKASAV